jgi:hypothetical protein
MAGGEVMLTRTAIAAVLLLGAVAAIDDPVRKFMGSLSPGLRKKSTIAFSSDERFNWGYTPRSRRGLATGDLSAGQRELLNDVLRSGLSEVGYRKAAGIVELEPILGEIEGSSFRDPARYHFTLFGDPSQQPWGWRFEGHHLSINATHTARGTSMTPMFLGANPARVPTGPRAGLRVLASEEILGRQMLSALDPLQRARAIINVRAPSDIVTGTDRAFSLDRFEGLPASAMNPAQRQLLMRLIANYVTNAPKAVADSEMATIRQNGIEKLHFAWAGGERPGQPHYYRVHGPTIVIEYDNTQNGANHIHTVWRKPGGDFGDDLLARHYATAGHHREARSAPGRVEGDHTGGDRADDREDHDHTQ